MTVLGGKDSRGSSKRSEGSPSPGVVKRRPDGHEERDEKSDVSKDITLSHIKARLAYLASEVYTTLCLQQYTLPYTEMLHPQTIKLHTSSTARIADCGIGHQLPETSPKRRQKSKRQQFKLND